MSDVDLDPYDPDLTEPGVWDVYAAAREIASVLDGYTVVVTKSTVPVGTGDEVERIIRELRPDAGFAVVSNPEFLREGAAIEDFKRPDRIVIGECRGAEVRELLTALNTGHSGAGTVHAAPRATATCGPRWTRLRPAPRSTARATPSPARSCGPVRAPWRKQSTRPASRSRRRPWPG